MYIFYMIENYNWHEKNCIFSHGKIYSRLLKSKILIYSADPQSWPVGIIVFAHVRSSVRPHFSKSSKTIQSENNIRCWQDCVWVWPRGSLMTHVLSLLLSNTICDCATSLLFFNSLPWFFFCRGTEITLECIIMHPSCSFEVTSAILRNFSLFYSLTSRKVCVQSF